MERRQLGVRRISGGLKRVLLEVYRIFGRLAYVVLYPVIWVVFRNSQRVYVLLRYGEEVLLIKNWLGSGKWTFPGGGVTAGESDIDGLTREISEELRIKLANDMCKPLTGWIRHRRGFRYRYYMVTLRSDAGIRPNTPEIIDMKWVRMGELQAYLHPKEWEVVRQALQSKS